MDTFGILPEKGPLQILSPFIHFLPSDWRESVLRYQLDLPSTLPKELCIKVADTLDEVEEAFEVVHDEYWDLGLIDKKSTEKLVSKFHLLPTSSVVVAKWNKEVVGTVCLVKDSLLGLPSEGLHSFNELRNVEGQNLAEATFFAVRENFIQSVSWPLIKYLYELARRLHNTDILILALPDNKDLILLCKSLFFIEPLTDDSFTPHPYLNYGSVRLFQLDYKNVNMKMIKHYWKKPLRKDLLNFLHNTDFENFEFPREMNQKWSADQLRQIFNDSEDLRDSLSEFEKLCLREFYQEHIYENILPAFNPEVMKIEERRKNAEKLRCSSLNGKNLAFYSREIRFKTDFKGLLSDNNEKLPVKVLDVSLNGMRIQCLKDIKIGQTFSLEVKIEKVVYQIQIRNIWAKKDESFYGFRVDENSKNWIQLIHYLIEKEQAS